MHDIPETETLVKYSKPLWVAMPNFMLRKPPIAHRGNKDPERITPFEFAVLAGILVAAYAALSEQRHHDRMRAGAGRMRRQRQFNEQFRTDWEDVAQQRRRGASKEQAPAPRMRHAFDARAAYDAAEGRSAWRPLKRRKLIILSGSEGYKAKGKVQRRGPAPAVIAFTVPSRYALLRFAGLTDGNNNANKLDAALDRLTQPIGQKAAGVLVEWKADGRALHLAVAGEWLSPGFERLPMPLPKHSNALALYLFLQSIKTSGQHRDLKIGFAYLTRLLGMSYWKGSSAQRAIDRALDLINTHLDNLPLATREQMSWLPACYQIKGFRGSVRFEAEAFDWSEEEQDAIDIRRRVDDGLDRDEFGDRIAVDDDDYDEIVPVPVSLPRRPLPAQPSLPRRPLPPEETFEEEIASPAEQARRQQRERLAQHRERLALYEAAAAGDEIARLRLGVDACEDTDDEDMED